MYLGTYDFDGDPDDLVARYDELLGKFPPEMVLLNVCIRRADGITIVDTCPTEADFRGFSTSAEFAAGLASVGLPTPRVHPLGEVHAAHGTHLSVPA
jgi:hypothetical protein